jgi:hypothetical protein
MLYAPNYLIPRALSKMHRNEAPANTHILVGILKRLKANRRLDMLGECFIKVNQKITLRYLNKTCLTCCINLGL